jgi:hypothetical protein
MTRIPRDMNDEEIHDWGLRLFEWFYEYGDGGDYNQVVEDFEEEFGSWYDQPEYNEENDFGDEDPLWEKVYANCAARADAARRHKVW